MIVFKKPELEDREVINNYLKRQKSRSCECTFANTYLWSHFYKVEYAIIADTLVYQSLGEKQSFTFPIGDDEQIKIALDTLMEHCQKEDIPFRLHLVTPEQFVKLEVLYPATFQINYDEDVADYVYEREKLANLSGKKYHGKKNHVNKFKRTYPDWKYETMTAENIDECFAMAMDWRELNGGDDEPDKVAEMSVTMNYLRLFHELEMTGGLLRVANKVVAFTIGEPVCEDTFVVHVEKALTEIEGVYPMINQQFVLNETDRYLYINREEDTGAEGLRQAKRSYRPVFMVEKGIVTAK